MEFKINFVLYSQFEYKTSLCFIDQETQKEIFWWNQLPCGPVLTPISCTKFKIHSMFEDSLIVTKQVFFLLCWQFGMWDQATLHRSRNSGRDFWWNQLPCGPVLTQSSRSILHMKTVQLFLNKFFSLVLTIWNVGPVNASQIKKLRKRFLVEPAPLWASSYTHLLYKAQDPFSPWTQSNWS